MPELTVEDFGAAFDAETREPIHVCLHRWFWSIRTGTYRCVDCHGDVREITPEKWAGGKVLFG